MAAYHCPRCGRRLAWCAVERVQAFVGDVAEQIHHFECGGCGQPLRVRVVAVAAFGVEAHGKSKEAA